VRPLRLENRTELQERARVCCDKARLKLEPGVPNRDQEGIDLAGKHIPETFQRSVLWCIKRYGILMPETATRTRGWIWGC
jgi:hypothetical protein